MSLDRLGRSASVGARRGEQVAAGRPRHRLSRQGSPKIPVRPVGARPDRTSFRAAAANRLSAVAASACSSPPEFAPFPSPEPPPSRSERVLNSTALGHRVGPCCDNLSAGIGSMQQRRKAQALMISFRSCSFLGGLILLGAGAAASIELDGASAEDGAGWTVATLARNGSWGVATETSLARAIGLAVSKCKAMSVAPSDCGAQFTTIRAGWTLALLCGEHKLLAAGKQLEEAWLAVQFRLDLKLGYLPDLPPCRQIFAVDPAGVVIFADPGTSAIPSR